MEYVAIIISLLALVGAGFAFIRANSSHNILSKRIETLKERNTSLELRLRKAEGNQGRGNRQANESETVRKNQPRQEPQETRQNQPRTEQQEHRQKQPRQDQPSDRRQKQRERQNQPSQQIVPPVHNEDEPAQQHKQKRKKENRRRNEPSGSMNYGNLEGERELPSANSIKLEIAGGDLLDELEQAAGSTAPTAPESVAVEKPRSGKMFAIIPEDGVIRQYQLQQQSDADSYIEVDEPAEGSTSTRYRFNLAGNHAFVIAQGLDRLENAFEFEKPSNRVVSKIVQQQDGVLTRVNNGWRIQDKAIIDFR